LYKDNSYTSEWVKAAIPTAAIPTNAFEKAQLTLTLTPTLSLTLALTLILTLPLTHCITHLDKSE